MMKMIKKLLTLLLVALMLTGCGETKQYVSYTIYPIGYLLNRIGGNRIDTVSIQTNTISQAANMVENYQELLNDSSVLFHIGGLEPYMDLYSDEIDESEVDIQDLSVLNALYEYKRYTRIIVNGKINYVESEYYDDEIFNEVDMYDLDPFIWLSPIGMLSMAKNVNEYLCNNYVEQSTYFNENYEKLADELIALDASYNSLSTQLMNQNQSIKFVSMTGSFGAWQKDYGFEVYPICLSRYGALPSDKQLEVIKARIVADGVKYIAYEPNMSEEMSILFSQIEGELGLKRVTLHNISSLTSSNSETGKDYMSLMYENLSILQNMATSQIEQVQE